MQRHRILPAVALVLTASCGGGSSSPTAADSYPSVKGIYGSYYGIAPGTSRQTWTSSDGTVRTVTCTAVTTIPTQNGAQFSGSIDRVSPCNDQATLAGQIAKDSTLRLTVTQGRWGNCTPTGTNEYTGVVSLGSLLVTGRVTARCDDGTTVTIEEQLTGSLSAPPTTPG